LVEEGDRVVEAKADIQEIIKDFIDSKWSAEADKGKATGLFKGLIYSDDAKAKKFVKALDALTSKMKAEDYK
jgi:hypothetical protein